jgi:hypothetical protein
MQLYVHRYDRHSAKNVPQTQRATIPREYSHFVLTENIRNLKHAAARAAAPPPESWELRRCTRVHAHPSPPPSEQPTPAQPQPGGDTVER